MWYFQGKIAGVAAFIGLFMLSAGEHFIGFALLGFSLFALFGPSWADIK